MKSASDILNKIGNAIIHFHKLFDAFDKVAWDRNRPGIGTKEVIREMRQHLKDLNEGYVIILQAYTQENAKDRRPVNEKLVQELRDFIAEVTGSKKISFSDWIELYPTLTDEQRAKSEELVRKIEYSA